MRVPTEPGEGDYFFKFWITVIAIFGITNVIAMLIVYWNQ